MRKVRKFREVFPSMLLSHFMMSERTNVETNDFLIIIAVCIVLAYIISLEYSKKLRKFHRRVKRVLGQFLAQKLRMYIYLLQRFTMPLFVDSAMLKVKDEFSPEELENIIQKFENEKTKDKKFRVREIQKMGKTVGVGVDDFVIREDGNLLLKYFFLEDESPQKPWLLRPWLGIPAIFWISFDFLFMLQYIRNFQFLLLNFLFYFLLLYSGISLAFIILIPIKRMRGIWILSRWIFILLPWVIEIHKYFDIKYFTGIPILYAVGFFLLSSESMFELHEYLEELYKFLPVYRKELRKKLHGRKRPICWIKLTRSLNDILEPLNDDVFNSNTKYVDLYFELFFKKENNKEIKWKKRLNNFLKNLKSVFRIKKENNKEIRNKLDDLWGTLIDEKDMNLILPYILSPTYTKDKISAHCLINLSEKNIIGINLPKEVINFMTNNGNLWKAKNTEDIVSSYLDYHIKVLTDMEKEITSPINPLIDPFGFRKYMGNVKKHITSLIRFDGLLFILKQSINNSEKIKRKLDKTKNKLKKLNKRYDEYLIKSDVILKTENSIRIAWLTIWVAFFTIVSIFIGIFEIDKIPISFPQFEFFSRLPVLIDLLGPTIILVTFITLLISRNRSS
jgi:hypothetical protein